MSTTSEYNDFAALQLAIYEWFSLLLTPAPTIPVPSPVPVVPTIWANQQGPQLPVSYFMLNVVEQGAREGLDDEVQISVGPTKERLTHARRVCLVSVNAYGVLATAWLFKLSNLYFEAEDSISILSSRNLALVDHTMPVDISLLEDTKIQERFQLDLRIRYTANRVMGAGNVVAVGIEDEISGETMLVSPP